jgi:hypothetical protein
MRPLLDLPNTRSGDAIRVLMATVIAVPLLTVANVVTGWMAWNAVVLTTIFTGLFQFAWYRWLHRPKATPPTPAA